MSAQESRTITEQEQKDIDNLEQLSSVVQILSNNDLFAETYGFRIPDYLMDRNKFAHQILDIADETQNIVKKAGIAKAASGGTSIAAGGLAISGIILAPFTAGVSLGLTYAGMATGIAAGITGATTEIIKNKKIKKSNQEIKQMKENFEAREDILVKLFDDFRRLSEEVKKLKKGALEKVMAHWQVAKAVSYGGYTYYTTSNIFNVVRVLGGDLRLATGTMATTIASPGTPAIFGYTLITAGGTTAKILSSSLAVIGIGFGTWDLVAGINDTNRSEIADNLRKFAGDYQSQTEDLMDFFSMISSIAKVEEQSRRVEKESEDMIKFE